MRTSDSRMKEQRGGDDDDLCEPHQPIGGDAVGRDSSRQNGDARGRKVKLATETATTETDSSPTPAPTPTLTPKPSFRRQRRAMMEDSNHSTDDRPRAPPSRPSMFQEKVESNIGSSTRFPRPRSATATATATTTTTTTAISDKMVAIGLVMESPSDVQRKHSSSDSVISAPQPPRRMERQRNRMFPSEPGAVRVSSQVRRHDLDTRSSQSDIDFNIDQLETPIQATLVEDGIKPALSPTEGLQAVVAGVPTLAVEAEPFSARHSLTVLLRSWKVRLGLVCIILVLLGIVVGVVFGTRGNHNSGDSAAVADIEPVTTESPSMIPTTSLAPSLAPSITADLDLGFFVRTLPMHTQRSLLQSSSAQSQALEWLKADQDLETYSLARRLQRFALGTIFFATAASGWTNSSNWLSNEHECGWYASTTTFRGTRSHVEITSSDLICEGDEYRRLSLGANNLLGGLPPEIGLLSGLEIVELQENSISGFIPTTFERLTNLKEVRLVDNLISGPIPPGISKLTSLRILDLEHNAMGNQIPQSLGQIPTLEILWLSFNDFRGTIPPEIMKIRSLDSFALEGNYLEGHIPESLEHATFLRDLFLSKNHLVGSIPAAIGLLTSAVNITLGNNTLTGSIPSQLGLLKSRLEYLDLYDNTLTGLIPTELGELTRIQVLYLEENELNGSLPTSIGALRELEEFWAYANYLDGWLPSEIGNCRRLTNLSLENNLLSGWLPSQLGFLWQLETLHLQDNEFSGEIPSELGELTNLREIRIYGNNFRGSIPTELCALVSSGQLSAEDFEIDCSGMLQCACCTCKF